VLRPLQVKDLRLWDKEKNTMASKPSVLRASMRMQGKTQLAPVPFRAYVVNKGVFRVVIPIEGPS
jgi:hypothetical protein